jgi:hypothetical protein
VTNKLTVLTQDEVPFDVTCAWLLEEKRSIEKFYQRRLESAQNLFADAMERGNGKTAYDQTLYAGRQLCKNLDLTASMIASHRALLMQKMIEWVREFRGEIPAHESSTCVEQDILKHLGEPADQRSVCRSSSSDQDQAANIDSCESKLINCWLKVEFCALLAFKSPSAEMMDYCS